MKTTIKKLLRESLLGEARATINDLENLILFHQKGDYLLIYDPINKIPIGYIAFVLNRADNVYPIYGIYAKNGFGPLLYELAMTYVYPNGITLDDGSPTSREAINVWDKFYSRNDIKKEPINRNKKTYKEKDLIAGCYDDVECLEEVKHILFLHNLKFSYTLGKENLNKMINLGNIFLTKNPNLDLNAMITKLEGDADR